MRGAISPHLPYVFMVWSFIEHRHKVIFNRTWKMGVELKSDGYKKQRIKKESE
jgi:hypothetical protein